MRIRVRSLLIVVVVAALAIQWSGFPARRAGHLRYVKSLEAAVADIDRSLATETNVIVRTWAAELIEHHRREAKAHRWQAHHPWQDDHRCEPIPMPRL
jgi:hypothetical protein